MNLKEHKTGIIVTLFVLILGAVIYQNFAVRAPDPQIYEDMRFKVAYSPEGQIKIFALADRADLENLRVQKGSAVPEKSQVVIGYEEAAMMKKELLFSEIGDFISDLFGISVYVSGVLSKTGSPIDDFHFLEEEQFNNLKGEPDRLYISLKDDMPKLFLYQEYNYSTELAEGKISDYKETPGAYPIMIGSKEAEMMRQENLFKNTGDRINDFFGRDVIIVGVLKQTNTALDMMHIVPFR